MTTQIDNPSTSALYTFVLDESGATAIEYGLFAALIAAVIVGTVSNIGQSVHTGFQSVETALSGGEG